MVKAVGMISGGLDSALATQVIKDLGVEVHGIYFSMPWGCCNKAKAQELAKKLGIKFIVMQLDESYLGLIKNPRFGYGTALNPCIDCRIHMFQRARHYMDTIGADFVFTGEVLGQRPMSQHRQAMETIMKESGLEGRLLRPLCARLLEPTIPEKEGAIDRNRLLALNGRSRKKQMQLASEWNVSGYLSPAGGCLLTDEHFSRKMKDILQYGYRNFRETISLKWGRHFRINPQFKAIVGRDEKENEIIVQYTNPNDIVMELAEFPGPTLILKGNNPSQEVLALAAGIVKYFSKSRQKENISVNYWETRSPMAKHILTAPSLSEEKINSMYIR